MVQSKIETSNVTLFEVTKEGDCHIVKVTRNDKDLITPLRCDNENQAELVRNDYVNRFWNGKMN